MRDALKLEIVVKRYPIVEHHNRAGAAGEEFLEREKLTPELKRGRGLASAWIALDQVQSVGRKTSGKKLIETGNASEGKSIGMGHVRLRHRSSVLPWQSRPPPPRLRPGALAKADAECDL